MSKGHRALENVCANPSKKVCICGGGNLGHVAAGFIASQPAFEVSLLTRQPERWSRQLVIDRPDGQPLRATLRRVSSDPREVVCDADVVLLCLPGYSIREVLMQVRGHLLRGAAVGSVVSSTGFFFQAMELLPAGTPLFGLQRVPFIARTEEYGRRAALLGYKESLRLAVEPSSQRECLRLMAEQLFKTPTILMDSYYEVSLSNSNPLLHPARLYDLWSRWRPGTVYVQVPLFYEEWTERAAELYIAMDSELHQLLGALHVRQESVPTVHDYYASTDAASLAHKLRSIEAFKGIRAPMQAAVGGFVPDFSSRYFTEDFPYGLAFVRRLAHEHNIPSPVIDTIFDWGTAWMKVLAPVKEFRS